MMTREAMLATIKALGDDATIFDEDDFCLDVTIEDFEGFTKNWDEIDRDLDNPEAVGAFLEMLETECLYKEGDFYVTYHFDGFDVEIGYASFDI